MTFDLAAAQRLVYQAMTDHPNATDGELLATVTAVLDAKAIARPANCESLIVRAIALERTASILNFQSRGRL